MGNYLQLYADTRDAVSDPVLAVRWCVTPELAETLRKANISDPQVLISVRAMKDKEYGLKETKRYLVPLTQELQYVSFSRPGLNAVTATVVGGIFNSSRRDIAKLLLHRHNGIISNYAIPLWENEYVDTGYRLTNRFFNDMPSGDINKNRITAKIVSGTTDEFFVTVPGDAFGKEPSQFTKDYIGKFVTTKPDDECHVRRRMLFTFPLMPFVFFFGYVARTVQALVAGALLAIPIHLDAFRHPNRTGADRVLEDARAPLWWFKRDPHDPDGYIPQNFFVLLFNPFNIFALGMLLFGFTSLPWRWKHHYIKYHSAKKHKFVTVDHGHHIHIANWGFWHCILIATCVFASVVAFVLVTMSVIATIDFLGDLGRSQKNKKKKKRSQSNGWAQEWKRKHRAKQQAAHEAAKEKRYHKLHESLTEMACGSQASKASLDALPRQKRTVKLRFQATKKKVCRPFAS